MYFSEQNVSQYNITYVHICIYIGLTKVAFLVIVVSSLFFVVIAETKWAAPTKDNFVWAIQFFSTVAHITDIIIPLGEKKLRKKMMAVQPQLHFATRFATKLFLLSLLTFPSFHNAIFLVSIQYPSLYYHNNSGFFFLIL